MNNNKETQTHRAEHNPEFLQPVDFRLFLQNELVRRIQKNPRYSLRSFANFLSINPGTISQILNNKRTITEKQKEKIIKRLGYSPELLLKLNPLTNVLPKDNKAHLEFRQLTLDSFQIIADWYHYAILELTRINNFKSDPKWIASKLGITVSQVHAAIERLLRLEYLEITSEGVWKDVSNEITTVGNDFTAIAFRKLQKQVLEMAITALEEVPYENRDNSSLTGAINSKELPQIKLLIKKFRRELATFMEKSGPQDQVYQLGIAFYPITKNNETTFTKGVK